MFGISLGKLGQVSGGLRFSPSALFSSGEQGAWYDPSDLPTLFQDSAGTTPVTAVEQPVGLVLDKSQGMALGSELVTNGTFDSGTTTGWTADANAGGTPAATLSVVSGRLRVACGVGGGRSGFATQSFTTIPGRSYQYRATGYTGTSSFSLRAGSTIRGFDYVNVSPTTGVPYSAIFTATTTTTYLSLVEGSLVEGQYAEFDNISVRELHGNHAYQTTSASRPTLRARYNLLTYSEQFDNAAWTKDSSTISANATTAPDGTNTADKVISTAVTAQIGVNQGFTAVATTYTASFSVKQAEVRYVQMLWSGGVSANYANFDLQTGTVTVASGGTATITAQANGFYRITLTSTLIAGATNAFLWMIPSGASGRAATYAGNGTDGFFVWGAQLTQTAVFPSNTYQRIAAATDYATGAAFPPYLFFDGVDDSLLTNSVDFSATDKMTVWAGVTRSSDVTTQIIYELGTGVSPVDGWFHLYTATQSYVSSSKGTVLSQATYTNAAITAPITNVATQNLGISTSTNIIRVNGVQQASNAATQGTGNYSNAPLHIGRRNNASLPLNGNIYSLIIRGAQSTAAQISSTESWVAAKTPLGSL